MGHAIDPDVGIHGTSLQVPSKGREPHIHDIETVQSQDGAGAPLAPWQTVVLVFSLCVGTLLVAIDTTIVSVAVPAISTEFKALDDVGWYGSSYLFTVTAFQPAFGSVYRFFDAKWTYLSSVVVFEVGSIIAAAAPSSPVFILGRAVQGVGAAGLYQGALAIISLTVALEQRPMTIGIVLSVFGLATCFGPPVGGVFTDKVSWRWCWWINLPIGAIAFFIILLVLKLPASSVKEKALLSFREKVSRLDFPGIVLVIAAVCCLVLALQWGGQSKAWGSADVIGLLVGAALLALAFVIVQWRKGDSATIPLRIFRQRTILMGSLYLFFLEMAIYAYLYFLPFYFQSAQMVDATESGVRSIPLGLSQIAAVICCSTLVSFFGHYVPLMILGQVIAIIGTVFLARLNVDTGTVLWATCLVVTGIGTGMGLQMPFTGVNVVLSQNDIPVGNAITVFVQQLGAAIAVAIGESIFSDSLRRDLVQRAVSIPTDEVVLAGATGIPSLSTDPAVIRLIQDAYCYAFQTTMYFALGALIMAIPFAAGMEWLNAKKVAEWQAATMDGGRSLELKAPA